jgi:hypothetical protein
MAKVGFVRQMDLELFADQVKDAEENGTGFEPLSAQEVRERNMASRQALQNKLEDGEIPSWAETYHRLLQANWPWRIAAYVAWATMPKAQRWPRTQDELARDVLGLNSDRVIATWRKRFPSIDQMIADLQAEALMEYRPGAFHALGSMASEHSYRANSDRRLLFEMTQDYTPRKKIETENSKVVQDLSEYSDADLEAMSGEDAKEYLRRIRNDADLPADSEVDDEDDETE